MAHRHTPACKAIIGPRSSVAAATYFFSTFQMNVTGEMITPDRLVR